MNRKHVLIFIAVAFTLVVLLVAGHHVFARNHTENKSTDTWSSSFQNQADKIEFLKQRLTCHSEVLDTEYHIVMYDNSTGLVPGPSEWMYLVAVKVHAEDLPLWLDDMREIQYDEIDPAWWDDLQLDNDKWDRSSVPVCYQRAETFNYTVVYQETGILLKYFYAM